MMKHLLILLTILISVNTIAQDEFESVVVLELFTSQGCSSCPPADELLEKIKKEHKNDQVFVLSYHVDYWNRLGWKDPFSKEAFSDYQRAYGTKFNSRSIYTPQLVVNGNKHFVGSNGEMAGQALRVYSKSKSSNKIVLNNVKQNNNSIFVDYIIEGDSFNNVVFAVIVEERITNISKGENRNRTLKNSNIVANKITKKDLSGNVMIDLPNWVKENDRLEIIAYTQDRNLKITGATQAKL